MKRLLLTLVALALVGGLVWLVWFKHSKAEEEDAKVETEVAVHVGRITRTTLRSHVTAYGVIEAEPNGERPAASARLAPAVAGLVTTVLGIEGQRVEKGALLFQLDSRTADAAAEKARKAVEYAEKTLERQRKLLVAEGTSQKLAQEAEQALNAARQDLLAAQTQQSLLRVEAPLAGTLVRVNVRPGEAVDLTTSLGEVVDLDRLVASAGVPSGELADLKPGLTVEILVEKGRPALAGSLMYVGSQVDAKTGTVSVRAAVPAGSGLRPGQFVTLRIVSAERKDCLAAPLASVTKDAEGHMVLAVVQKDKAVQTPVKTGLRDGDLVEVEGAGLAADAVVVTEGAYALPKETKVHVVADVAGEARGEGAKP